MSDLVQNNEKDVKVVENDVKVDEKDVKVDEDEEEDTKNEEDAENEDEDVEEKEDVEEDDDSPETLFREAVETGLISDEDDENVGDDGDWTYDCSDDMTREIAVLQIGTMAEKKEWSKDDCEKLKESYESINKRETKTEDIQNLGPELLWILLGKCLHADNS